mmetsp:Transcript_16309/g.25843  ORF Transcript_16309/g.25843 Transcript_16309/m.25843 type:complete len:217 (+) Transcript_16309:553-1203(+)
MEEGVLDEEHTRELATKAPDVEGVVVSPHPNEELWSLKVAGGNAHIVLLSWVIELCQAPVDEPQLLVSVVNHDVMGLNITVHDAARVTIVESLEKLVHIVLDIHQLESWVENLEVLGVHVLEYEGRNLRLWILNALDKLNDVGAVLKVLEDLDLSLDLFFPHRLENLDDNLSTCLRFDPLEDLTIFPSPNLAHHLVPIRCPPLYFMALVVPVLPWF